MAYPLAWRPSYLRRRIISIFLVVFLLMIAGLEILYQYSLKHHGFVSSNEGLHYLWTYGPTASEYHIYDPRDRSRAYLVLLPMKSSLFQLPFGVALSTK